MAQESPFPNDGKERFVLDSPEIVEMIRLGYEIKYQERLKLIESFHKKPLLTYTDSLEHLFVYTILARSLVTMERHQEGVNAMLELARLTKAWNVKNSAMLTKILVTQASIYSNFNYFNEAKSLIDSALVVYKAGPYQNEDYYLSLVENKTNIYNLLPGESDSVIKYLDTHIDIMENHASRLDFEPDYNSWELLLNRFGAFYTKIGDFSKSLSYYLECLRRIEQTERKHLDNYVDALFGVSVCYYYREEFAKAIVYAHELVELVDTYGSEDNPLLPVQYYNLLAVNYNGIDKPDSALIWLKKCEELLLRENSTDIVYNTLVMNIGVTQTKQQDYDQAGRSLMRALQLNKNTYGTQNPAHGIFYRYLSDYSRAIGKKKEALAYIDSALYSLLPGYQPDPLGSLEVTSKDLTFDALEYLNLHTREMMAVYHQDPKQTKYLDAIIDRAMVIQGVLDSKQNSLSESESLLIQSNWFKAFYETLLEALHLKYESTGEALYLKQIKGYLASSKSRSFSQELGEFSLINNADVPDSIRYEYVTSRREVDRLDGILKNLMENSVINDSIKTLNSEKLNWNNRLVETRNYLRENFIEGNGFYSPITDLELILDSYEVTDPSIGLIEYFFGEREILIYAASQDNFVLERISRDSVFNQNLDLFINEIGKNEQPMSPASFGQLSHELYTQLLLPVLEKLGSEVNQLIIVPDEKLTLLPFDLLVSESPGSANRMQDLHFVIKDYAVSYEMTTVHPDQKEKSLGPAKILGFGYEGEGIADERAALGGLPGAASEIRFLEKKFSGSYAIGPRANKQRFLENAEDYEVLHLALHGKADLQNRFHSSLIFNGDSDYDLKTFDLYGVAFNAEMVVLSACESGLGQLTATEGTYSVGRGFASMGVPAVVTTLWKVNDMTSSEIVQSFYENLDKGMTKDEALRQAKLDFLKQADEITSHPYFWGSFVVMGDTSPITIQKASSFRWYWLLALVLVIFIVSRLGTQPMRKAKA